MRINHNIASMTTQNALFQSSTALSKSLQRLSTGLRINRAADDAAGLGISEVLRAQVNGTAQASRNAQEGISVLNIADGAANEMTSVLQRMRELAIQTSNDTLTANNRTYANGEFQALKAEIDRIAATTNYNGVKLISSDTTRFGVSNNATAGSGSSLWIDANKTYGADSITVTISTLTNAKLFGGNNATLGLTTRDLSISAVTAIDNAIDSVNNMRANVGAIVNRLEHAITNLGVSNTNQQAAESVIRDADFATETANYTRNQIMTQSATAMLAQANMVPQSILTLLGR